MKIWKVVECRDKELEAILNTVSKSWEVFSIHSWGVMVTIVAYQVKEKPAKKNNAK